MAKSRYQLVNKAEALRFAWSELERLKNVEATTRRIIEKHSVPRSQISNAKKQAEQIRYCIEQSMEYNNAAESVSDATKPVQSYYCLVSLALAEILYKQSGLSSLDKARENNRHHGLIFLFNSSLKSDLKDALLSIRARPHQQNGRLRGTFGLWFQTAGRPSNVGVEKFNYSDASTETGYRIVLDDNAKIDPSEIINERIALLDCMQNLPQFADALGTLQIENPFVRGRVSIEHYINPPPTIRRMLFENRKICDVLSIIIHPAPRSKIEKFSNNLALHPSYVNHIDVKDKGRGYIITISTTKSDVHYNFELPNALNTNKDDIFFNLGGTTLNEFGQYYVGLFILSNLARYYPDIWMPEIYKNTDFFMLCRQFITIAQRKLPLLLASEINDCEYIED